MQETQSLLEHASLDFAELTKVQQVYHTYAFDHITEMAQSVRDRDVKLYE